MSLPNEVLNWNRTHKAYPLDRPITSFIEEQIAKTPDALAVTFGKASITYAELNRRTNRLARSLRSWGVGTDQLVGVYMERSVEMVVALVGIVKAGGAYVPFDPEYPQDRLTYMFDDSQVRVVLTQRAINSALIPKQARTVYLDDAQWSNTTPEDDDNPPLEAGASDACYMIYTSGSTGKPKGVVNVHRALVNRLLWMQEAFLLGPHDRVLQKTPYSFDVSVWEFFWPLITGASIVMATPGGHRDNQYLVETIVGSGITTMHFVPSMLSLFVSSEGLERITTLRQVMSSGEALPYELTRRFFDKLPTTELHNLYGPTEAAIDVTHWACKPDADRNIVPIGKPIANVQTYILDDELRPVAIGDEGELHLAGVQLARGYWNRPELTTERFIPNPFSVEKGARMYKTGDLARYLPDGNIEYLGRLDNQVKLRGFRIELGEIEATLLQQPGVAEAVVIASDDSLEERQLVAFVVTEEGVRPAVTQLREGLLSELPDYMVPARFDFLPEMPLTPNGKVDRRALTATSSHRPELSEMYVAPQTAMEVDLCDIWKGLLGLDRVGIRDNFFELGGNSIKAVRLAGEIQRKTGQPLPVVKVFEFGRIDRLAAYLSGDAEGNKADLYNERATRMRIGRFSGDASAEGIAVIGMTGRFPGANTIEELWSNLENGVESVSRFGPNELDPWVDEETRSDPNYVPVRGIVEDADKFDARFFGIGPMEAKVMDPQQRVFLELAWAALENAGYDPERYPGMIGVYAGVGDNHYYTRNVLGHRDICKTVGNLIVGYGNEKDYIATRVSFSLNLTGPSVSANTGCSTSLLAVDNAFKALVDYECDMALAGGIDIHVPQKTGQMYTQGGTFTKDGHCRPFDAEATGTMFSDGAGIVVLKRLQDALADGDRIYAVVRGIAKNNDGANKVSFLAPSVEGQAQVIALAHAQANITADTISYVEAHGTGTPLGDPIEIEGLTKAFGITTDKKQFCGIGSIKGNVGHPTIASGIAGFIKVCLSLDRELIPPTLHFKTPNRAIDFSQTPFSVVAEPTPWPRTDVPRRAGVSSFGFGGTNVHGVLQEAPVVGPSSPSGKHKTLFLSAKTDAALGRLLSNVADYFKDSKDLNLADAAYTLQVGRKHLEFRKFVVCTTVDDAIEGLRAAEALPARRLSVVDPSVTFMFPGQGSQYVNMGRDLYAGSEGFRASVDECCDILKPHLDRDLRELLFPDPEDEESATASLNATASLKDTYYTQPALFVIEYSLARFWMSLGIQPAAFVGHSVGEFAGACLAGVFSLQEALPLVALRGKLVRSMPTGSMLSVRCPAEEVLSRLPDDVQLAAANSPSLCVVAGPDEAIERLSASLDAEGLVTRHLHTSHAFHSAMMDPVVGDFIEAVRNVKLAPPRIPVMSTCTGDWLTAEQATSPEYWGEHLRKPVLFSNAIGKMLAEQGGAFLEVGPRDVLTTLGRQQAQGAQRMSLISTLANSGKDSAQDEWADVAEAIGGLWANGVELDWTAYYAGERRYRVPLPTYPFERTSHWLPTVDTAVQTGGGVAPVHTEATSVHDPTPTAGIDGGGAGAADAVMVTITGILSETVGVDLEPGEESTPFVMLGADSLVLMQAARLVKERLGLAVSFRQLLDEYSSPRLLAQAVRDNSPELASAVPGESAAPPSRPEGTGTVEATLVELRTAYLDRDENGRLAWFIPAAHADGKPRQIRI